MVSDGSGLTAQHPSAPYSAGLRRDLEVLRELASEESLRRSGLGVVRIAERLGRENSQVSRALRALEAEGLVERDPRTRAYQLGWGLYRLAARGVETRLVRAAAVHLRRLGATARGQSRLCVLIGGQVLSLVTAGGAVSVPFGARDDGRATPLMSTPAGPALLLDWPDAAIAGLRAETASDPTETDRLSAHLRQARQHGYVLFEAEPASPDDSDVNGRSARGDGRGAAEPMELAEPAEPPDPTEPVVRVAAPVRDFRGIVLAAIELRCAVADPAPACEATVAAAAALSADLGFEPR